MLNKKTYLKLFRLSKWLGNKPVFILFMFICSFVRAQNLVPNGDFEQYWVCPNGAGNLLNPPIFPLTNPYSPKFWYDPNISTSDYFNTCSTLPAETGVPYNSFGFQLPHSGNAYCGFNGIATCPEWCAEYIATPLNETLIAGQTYCLSFWIVNTDSACWVNNGLGACFSSDSIHFDDYLVENLPNGNILFDEIITDTSNWTLFSGMYEASGGEKFLSIGNFSDGNFDTLHICNSSVWNLSYYFIDDVSLVDCSDTIDEFTIPNVFTPNGDNINDGWILNTIENVKVSIINRWGNVVFEEEGKTISWEGKDQTEGVYYYKIETKNTIKTGFIQLMR